MIDNEREMGNYWEKQCTQRKRTKGLFKGHLRTQNDLISYYNLLGLRDPVELALQIFKLELTPLPCRISHPSDLRLQEEALSLSVHFLKHVFHIQPLQLLNYFNIDVKRFMWGLEPD